MEKALEKHMDEVFRMPGVSGIICVDNSGLCLGAKGIIPNQCSGSISALASQAAKLAQSPNAPSPVICLESDHGAHGSHKSGMQWMPTPELPAVRTVLSKKIQTPNLRRKRQLDPGKDGEN